MPTSPQKAALAAERRRRAQELRAEGWKPSQIARILGVTPSAVSHWLQRVEGQPTAQSAKRRSQLSAPQLEQLLFLLPHGPATYRLSGPTWTRKTIAMLIQQKFDVHIQEEQVTRVLQKIGWKLRPHITRLQVWELKREGKTPTEIADQLGISLLMVQQWFLTSDMIRRTTRRQRTSAPLNSKLTLEQLQELAQLLLHPPECYGIQAKTWTRQAICGLIQQNYGVSFSLNHIPYLLRRMKRSLHTTPAN